MNKSAIKNYAIWARNKLISDIEYKAGLMGITEKSIAPALPQSTNEVQFFDIGTKDYASVRGDDIRQRDSFIAAIRAKEQDVGYAQAFRFIVEKVAYTWFNRLVAIRFMEVNDYLPSRVRVLSSENPGKAEPDMVTRPFDTDMTFTHTEEDLIMRLKDENKLDELFRWLFIKQCKKLHDVLPVLFSDGQDEDYLELLLTISFTDKDGVLWHLVHDIPEDDFNVEKEGQVEIIGWMYQYYNTEPKDQVFADLKKNIKISKDKIPAATQLFTPDWIVRYMVENSLGRLWVEGHSNEDLKKNWKYYLEEAEQEPEVQAQLAEIRKEYAKLRPEEIKVIDPCMGSGHILVYLFDVLMQIYESQGWTQREAAQSIVQNNLYGLDIDERAAQLAYFAVMMKARQYDRRFLDRSIEPHVYDIRESNGISSELLDYFAGEGSMEAYYSGRETPKLYSDIATLMKELRDAKEYGSILNITNVDFPALYARFDEIKDDISMYVQPALTELLPLVQRAEVMAQKYDVVVTNPPYMRNRGMSACLSKYIQAYYEPYKFDLYAVFIKKCQELSYNNGFIAMITQHSFMFLSRFDKIRDDFSKKRIVNMLHLGTHAFEEIGGEVVQTTTFVVNSSYAYKYVSRYQRLTTFDSAEAKEQAFLDSIPSVSFYCQQEKFKAIPGGTMAYWISQSVINAFQSGVLLSDIAYPRKGNSTSDNDKFLRLWFEVESSKMNLNATCIDKRETLIRRWFPYNKGGPYRKWYGNNDYVVDWYNDAEEMRKIPSAVIANYQFFTVPGVTWSTISGGNIGVRRFGNGFIFDNKGECLFCNDPKELDYFAALLNSAPAMTFLSFLSPTLDFNCGYISKIPIAPVNYSQKEQINALSQENVLVSKRDWDSYETSWDFQKHPLIRESGTIAENFSKWKADCENQFQLVKHNEEELNRLFIDIYSLQDELSPEVDEKAITIRKADVQRDMRSLISYSVGCMFGRYSLDADGLVYAGGEWDPSKYTTFIPDPDNCIPVTDEPYFEDDIVGRFVNFVRVVYGADTLEENLTFIANALGNKGTSSREVIRNYFLNDFFKDHCSTYSVSGSGKRPIYWLFDSGNQNGFKALVYMHRWNADTIGNVRVEYLHRMQKVYEKEIERMQDIIDNSRDNREISRAAKRREKLTKQLKETQNYDSKIAHAALSRINIDLDDGVKVNYKKVQKGPDGKSLGILASL